MVTILIYLGDLGGARWSDELRPRARWRGGVSAAAQVAVFHVDGAMSHGNIMTQANTHPDQALT